VDFPAMSKNPIRTVLEMIKFEHSVFALPFALIGALLAARATNHAWPSVRQILWLVVAMVAARSAAMAMNRIADLRYDRENPRTQTRALVTGALSLRFAWLFTGAAVAFFFVAAWQLNSLALKLAPLATPSPSASPLGRTCFLDSRWVFRLRPRGSRSLAAWIGACSSCARR
jgi:4-hydroxybenzoate polyprenyltransferase